MKLKQGSDINSSADSRVDWLLRRIGVYGAADLGGRDVFELARQMRYVNMREGYVRRTPTPDQIALWVDEVRTQPSLAAKISSSPIDHSVWAPPPDWTRTRFRH